MSSFAVVLRHVADNLPVRGSMRSRGAAAISSVTLRQVSAVLPPERAWGLGASRRSVSGVMDTLGPSLAGTQVEHVDVRMPGGGRLIGEWVLAAGVRREDRAIYYVHGSGYALCSPRTHPRLTAWLSALTGLPVFVVDYPRVSTHRFPAAATDVRTGWDWLTEQHGLAPQRLIIAGDPARCHLAVDMLLQPDVAHPASMILMSPLIDLSFDLARTREALRRDPAIRVRDAKRLAGLAYAKT